MLNGEKKILIAETFDIIRRADFAGAERCKNSIQAALVERNYSVDTFYVSRKSFTEEQLLKEKIINQAPYCVFNIFEGFIEDGSKEAEFARILEDIGVPFTGNSSLSLRLCHNKIHAHALLAEHGIPVPKTVFVNKLEDITGSDIEFPVFIKPCCADASFGIDQLSHASSQDQLLSSVSAKLKEFPKGLVVQEFISGPEYNIGLAGDYPYELIGVSVLDYARYPSMHQYLTYESKWDTASQEYRVLMPEIDTSLSKDLCDAVVGIAREAGRACGCRNYFRVDIRERGGAFYVLDVNPNPDINEDSGFMKMAYSQGYSFADMLEKLIVAAQPQARTEACCE